VFLLEIRKITDSDREWVEQFILEKWHSSFVVRLGEAVYPKNLEGFVVEIDDQKVGLITFQIVNDQCEIVTINSTLENSGVGSVLISKVKEAAIAYKCRRLWLITTNDNLPAMRFYQKRGFCFKKVYPNALEISRKIKPEIPKIGILGIPLRDEIEFELVLK